MLLGFVHVRVFKRIILDEYSAFRYNIGVTKLQGRVKFPIGGYSPRAKAGVGEIPTPTVQSGWKKFAFFIA